MYIHTHTYSLSLKESDVRAWSERALIGYDRTVHDLGCVLAITYAYSMA